MFPDLYGSYISKLSDDLFSDNTNKAIFKAVRKVYTYTNTVDTALVIQECYKNSEAKIVIIECANSVFKSTPFYEHYKILLSGAENRFLKDELESAIIENKLNPNYLQTVIDTAKTAYSYDSEDMATNSFDDFVENMDKPRNVVYTYFPRVDEATGGLRKGTLTIIGARPSVGKTTLAVNIATETALKNKKVIIFTLEMSTDMIIQKIASSKCNIPYTCFNGVINKVDKELIKEYFSTSPLRNNLIIKDNINTIENICGYILSTNPDIVFIDYAQIINTLKSYDNKRLQIDYISSELKRIAKQTNCCIVLLSQLKRCDTIKPPTMANVVNLRKSEKITHKLDNEN